MSECGLACLAMIAAFHGHDLNLLGLRRRFQPSCRGTNLKQLVDYAAKLHFNSRALKFEMEHLGSLQRPCILHWDLDHFVVLKSVSRKSIVIHDPAFGVRSMSQDEFRKHSTGVALELKPAELFRVIHERPRLKIWQLFSQTGGLKRGLSQVLLLSLLLMVLTLGLPIFVQLILDDVLTGFDEQLLQLLILGLLAVTVFRSACAYLRGMFLLFIGRILSFNASASVFHRLMRLPLVYFERRHIGDLISRFSSLEQIKRFLTEGMIEAVVDGIMTVLMLGMMLIYSPKLSALTIAAVFIYCGMRLALFRSFRLLSEEAIVNQGREQSNFLETLRGIQSIKLYGGENERHGLWQNFYSRVLNANTGLGRFRVGFQSLQDLVFGAGRAVVLYWGVTEVFNQQLSIGMLIAFLSYQEQFSEKIRALIEHVMQFRMLDLHADRIADIVLEDVDHSETEYISEFKLNGRIELQGLSFRYDAESPFLLQNINLHIQAGESLAIAGPSGSGKTTLLKIMVGLFRPSEGRILVDGIDLRECRSNFQQRIATVMQDDHLLSGSITDNIAFFDSQPNMDRVMECARMACIHEDIMRLPMRYNSLIGDMGSTLSGGQKQRILLARALYRQPDILFLDEATSHLDQKAESVVNAAIRELRMTRVTIAHRTETLLAADRILLLSSQGIREFTPDAYRNFLQAQTNPQGSQPGS
jgi:ATP-binding cassette subfamily B protein RaxB